MKILTATAATQGYRANDFDYCIEGELVYIGMVCAKDRSDPDGGCGCGRAFAGLNSHRATTTAMIREIGFTRDDYVEALRSGLDQQGWDTADAPNEADSLLFLADILQPGVIVERRLGNIAVREQVQS